MKWMGVVGVVRGRVQDSEEGCRRIPHEKDERRRGMQEKDDAKGTTHPPKTWHLSGCRTGRLGHERSRA